MKDCDNCLLPLQRKALTDELMRKLKESSKPKPTQVRFIAMINGSCYEYVEIR